MRQWKYQDALSAVESLNLEGKNRMVAAYWLSLWRGDRPPTRAAFDPRKVAYDLPAIGVVEVRPGESARVRLAGSLYRLALGVELTGADMVSLAAPEQRAERMRNMEAIVTGNVFAARRPIQRGHGAVDTVQEICLPFADPGEEGSRRYLFHTNWRPAGIEMCLPDRPRAHTGIPSKVTLGNLS